MEFKQLLKEYPLSPRMKVILYYYNFTGYKDIKNISSEYEFLSADQRFFSDFEFHYLMDFKDNFSEYREYLVWRSIFSFAGIVDTSIQKEYSNMSANLQEHKHFICEYFLKAKLNSNNFAEKIENVKIYSYLSNKEVSLNEIFEHIIKSSFHFYLNIFLILLINELFDNQLLKFNIISSLEKLKIVAKYNEGVEEFNKEHLLENIKNFYIQNNSMVMKSAKMYFKHIVRPLEEFNIIFDEIKIKKLFDKVDEEIVRILNEPKSFVEQKCILE